MILGDIEQRLWDNIVDRKYNGDEAINTLRKFPAEEKAYMAQYDEWKIR